MQDCEYLCMHIIYCAVYYCSVCSSSSQTTPTHSPPIPVNEEDLLVEVTADQFVSLMFHQLSLLHQSRTTPMAPQLSPAYSLGSSLPAFLHTHGEFKLGDLVYHSSPFLPLPLSFFLLTLIPIPLLQCLL